MPTLATAVRRTTAATMLALALSWAAAGAAEAAIPPPDLGDCYQISVTSPTTGEHPTVDVCPPF
ncbi:MAG: hypothetical protein QOI82_497 [Actinomycetota bacterium]|jgi:hypothetical protein|nr:hypothetical protein [Actinomycetota bacterium]